jgi:hypothetical protein
MSEEAGIVVATLIKCPKCGQEKPADTRDRHMCVDCAKAETSRYFYYRQHQGDWMAAAKDAGIDPWLQQPGETQWEYTIWCTYRDSYPGKKPSYSQVAEKLGTTKGVVAKVAQRWTFQARMQLWMAECDRETMQQRREAMLSMNRDQIAMSERLRDKLSVAIDSIVPETLKPGEIATLVKVVNELERKARIDEIAQEELIRDMSRGVENPNLKKSPTKTDDLSEVISILTKAGALGAVTQIGVRETTTREIVAMDGSGQTNTIEVDE